MTRGPTQVADAPVYGWLLPTRVFLLKIPACACLPLSRSNTSTTLSPSVIKHEHHPLSLDQTRVSPSLPQSNATTYPSAGDRLEEQVENAANRCGRLKKAVDDRVHLMHLWGMWKVRVLPF